MKIQLLDRATTIPRKYSVFQVLDSNSLTRYSFNRIFSSSHFVNIHKYNNLIIGMFTEHSVICIILLNPKAIIDLLNLTNQVLGDCFKLYGAFLNQHFILCFLTRKTRSYIYIHLFFQVAMQKGILNLELVQLSTTVDCTIEQDSDGIHLTDESFPHNPSLKFEFATNLPLSRSSVPSALYLTVQTHLHPTVLFQVERGVSS